MDANRDRIPIAAIALERIFPHMVKGDRQARELYNLARHLQHDRTNPKTSPQITLIKLIYADQESSIGAFEFVNRHPCSSVVRFAFFVQRKRRLLAQHKAASQQSQLRINNPTIEADMRFAMVPAIMARKPSFASWSRLLGASAPMPPI